jgi:hypothetical protein
MTITPEQRAYARLAGIMYLANYVLQDLGDRVTLRRGPESFADTARWAAESAVAYRVALVEVAAAWIAISVLAFALFAVLEPVNKRLAQLALLLRLGASFVGAASLMFRVAQARLYQASATEGLFTADQLRTLVAASQRASSAGVTIAWMFLGAGSMLFFALFLRSRYLPRALAGFGILASALLVVMAVAMFVFPEGSNKLKLVGVPTFLAEVATALWLLCKGLHPRAAAEAGT